MYRSQDVCDSGLNAFILDDEENEFTRLRDPAEASEDHTDSEFKNHDQNYNYQPFSSSPFAACPYPNTVLSTNLSHCECAKGTFYQEYDKWGDGMVPHGTRHGVARGCTRALFLILAEAMAFKKM